MGKMALGYRWIMIPWLKLVCYALYFDHTQSQGTKSEARQGQEVGVWSNITGDLDIREYCGR